MSPSAVRALRDVVHRMRRQKSCHSCVTLWTGAGVGSVCGVGRRTVPKRTYMPNIARSVLNGTPLMATEAQAREAVLALLSSRRSGATICPSEAARSLATDWRSAMPTVHAAVDALVEDGAVRISWKGRVLPKREGPYRIGRR
ncbi:MAG: DUF3253 domain-containing protein [Sphingobium sp.]